MWPNSYPFRHLISAVSPIGILDTTDSITNCAVQQHLQPVSWDEHAVQLYLQLMVPESSCIQEVFDMSDMLATTDHCWLDKSCHISISTHAGNCLWSGPSHTNTRVRSRNTINERLVTTTVVLVWRLWTAQKKQTVIPNNNKLTNKLYKSLICVIRGEGDTVRHTNGEGTPEGLILCPF